MAYQESDGIGEMLEGGNRALATAALRVIEIVNTRRAWAARVAEAEAREAARTADRHQEIVGQPIFGANAPATPATAAAPAAEAAPAASRWSRGSRLPGRSPESRLENQRVNRLAVLTEQHHLSLSPQPNPADLFPYMDLPDSQNTTRSLFEDGNHVGYLSAYNEVIATEARQPTGASIPDLHGQVRTMFASADFELTMSHAARQAHGEAQQLADVRRLLAMDSTERAQQLLNQLDTVSAELMLALPDRTETETLAGEPLGRGERPPVDPARANPEQRINAAQSLRAEADRYLADAGWATTSTAELTHEAQGQRSEADVRADRAAEMHSKGIDSESREAAMIHDLTFGTTPAESVTAPPRKATKAKGSPNRSRANQKARPGISR